MATANSGGNQSPAEALIAIRFVHRTFPWSNEGKNVAAALCVVIGFGLAGAGGVAVKPPPIPSNVTLTHLPACQ